MSKQIFVIKTKNGYTASALKSAIIDDLKNSSASSDVAVIELKPFDKNKLLQECFIKCGGSELLPKYVDTIINYLTQPE